MFRRALPEHFALVATRVEAAKDALLEAVPAPRRAPASLASSLVRFDERLEAAREALRDWDPSSTPEIRQACAAAVDEALRRSASLRLQASSLDFESLVLVLGDVIAPLDAFADAEHALRRRR